jgi:phosphate:Na+ symporter
MILLISYVTGGLVLFLYGMRLASDGLREAAGGHLKTVLSVLSSRRSTAVLIGIVVTFLLSSSSAVSVLLVDLANAGLISLPQAILVLLGATVGTALTVQIIAFPVTSYALILVVVGYLVQLLAHFRRAKALGTALLGLGLIFFGLDVINRGLATTTTDTIESLRSWLDYSLLGFALGVILSAFLRSAATVGIAVVLAGNGVPLVNLVPVVLGASVGTCSAPLLAAVRGGRRGKQVAVADLAFRLVLALVFLPLVGPLAEFVTWLTAFVSPESSVSGLARRSVAHVQFLTALVTVLAVLPVTGFFVKLVQKMMGGAREIPPGAIQYIHFDALLAPEVALTQAHREVVRMAEITRSLVARSVQAVLENNEHELERLEAADDRIDVIDLVLSQYLQRLKPAGLDPDALEVKFKLLYIIKDIEAVADLATRDLVRIGWEKSRDNVQFVDGEKQELDDIRRLLDEDLGMLVEAVRGADASESLRSRILERDRDLDLQRMRLFDRQFARVARGVPGAEESTAAYMNTLNALRMMHFLVSDILRMISEPPPGRAASR